ncbi:hypothetical protein ESCO_004742 [Escovopsis weberi]|uniref:DUF8004 domain-containing protein n=1 Tax=Escovopsis weberi TaxID=150374 RepID=A0A0M9VRS1_ESCWE|nr:hypothetical protein ESCO_004742 [Escovopsis weberi]
MAQSFSPSSSRLQNLRLDSTCPPLEEPALLTPAIHGFNADEWTLQTSILDDPIESRPLQQAHPDPSSSSSPPSSSRPQPEPRPQPESLLVPIPEARPTAPLASLPESHLVPQTEAPQIQTPILSVNVTDAGAGSSPVLGQQPASSPSPSPSSQTSARSKTRRSWLPSGRSRANSFEMKDGAHARNNSAGENVSAWVIAEDSRPEYNTSFLRNGEKVPELWNQDGAVLVYLFPKGSGHGPSFKVPEFTVSTSLVFNELIRAEMAEMEPPRGHRSPNRTYGGSLSVEDATRLMSPTISPQDEYFDEMRLYIPMMTTSPAPEQGQGAAAADTPVDLNRLIAVRNLFAFLTGQPFVGTKAAPNNFRALLGVADLLEEFGFYSEDGITFGTAVDLSFGFYLDQLGLADCRHSREETLEALILGERMRSSDLYNEAFAHAAGKYAAIMELRLPIFEQVSRLTRERLERAHLDLVNRQHNVNETLEQFEFPSLFAGIAASTSSSELKAVRFKIWKASFQKMRQFVLGYYRNLFGSWPPKASNKRNPFAESGLNRLVLNALYSDMCALYDLLVDRTNLTSRVIDEVPALSEEPGKMTTSALRNILSEFDRSKPPVLPPIPFDLPQLPTMASVLETYNGLSAKEQAKFDKKIKEHELILVLNKAYNYDMYGLKIPFLDQFKEFELREARGKTAHDLSDFRIGCWLFLYSVLQSLPMLVVDAPSLVFTEGTEYFLCEPPMGNPPWVDARQVRKMWYEVAGGGGYVELSADAVNFSPEAVYHRSHCWLAAKQWEEMNERPASPTDDDDHHDHDYHYDESPLAPPLSPLQPPQGIFQGASGHRGSLSGNSTPSPPPPAAGSPKINAQLRRHSPGRRRASQAMRSSIVMGLEPIPLEPPPSLDCFHQRSSSLGSGQQSSPINSRSVSVGNLVGLVAAHDPRSSSPKTVIGGATFDDILGDAEEKKSKKKRSRFFQ